MGQQGDVLKSSWKGVIVGLAWWFVRRKLEEEDSDPTVLCIGPGMAGDDPARDSCKDAWLAIPLTPDDDLRRELKATLSGHWGIHPPANVQALYDAIDDWPAYQLRLAVYAVQATIEKAPHPFHPQLHYIRATTTLDEHQVLVFQSKLMLRQDNDTLSPIQLVFLH